MSFSMPRDPGRMRLSLARRRGRVLVPTLVVLALLAVAFVVFANFYTELLWFRSVNAAGVFGRQLTTRIGLFLVLGLVFGAVVVGNAYLAFRVRPVYIPSSTEQQSLDRYRMALDPVRRLLLLGLGVLLVVIAGLSSAAQWKTYLLWRNGSSFGQRDPQFHLDKSFYVFDLPWYRFLLDYGFSLLVLTILITLLTHYLYGGIRLQGAGDRTTDAARVQLSVLLGLFVLLKAVAYVVDRWSLAVSSTTIGKTNFTGLTYTDINAVLPAKTILAWVALICGVLFFANVVRRTWLLPGLGFGALLVAAVLIGGVYPALFQQLRVKPSEADREAPQLSRNITETRLAYGLDKVATQDYDATPGVPVPASAPNLQSVRLIDPYVVPDSFTQLQGSKNYYRFANPLDIDRYDVGGKVQEMVVGVREVDNSKLQPGQRNWNTEVTAYTHGYGIFAAPTNTTDEQGNPQFVPNDENGAPGSPFGKYEPRIYFGEYSPTYSVVGAPKGTPPVEIEAPTGTNAERNYTYQGTGGVSIGSEFRRLLYAWKYRDTNLLLSSRVNGDSRILDDREPRTRVQKVAPWLTVDGDPYPAVVDGRIVWILDGYTTSSSYPYATHTTLDQATEDVVTDQTNNVVAAQTARQISYIRNSVKATVDAYSGAVTLYAWDESDPVLKAWRSAFPGIVKDRKDISPALLAHLRYPEDLFKVQRELEATYHVTDPREFYNGSDYWRVPLDPDPTANKGKQPPYYLTMQMPGQTAPDFSLSTSLVPFGSQENLAGFMSVDSDPRASTYGTIRLLRVTGPEQASVQGPKQTQNNFISTATSGGALSISLLKSVDYGNLLTLPNSQGGQKGFLYVEPIFVRGAAGTSSGSFPRLQRALVGNGQDVGFAATLPQALTALAQGGTPPSSGTEGTPGGTGGASPSATPSPSATLGTTVQAVAAEALRAYNESQQALANKDLAAYARYQDQLARALARLQQLTGGKVASPLPSAGAAGSPATASPSATPASGG